MQTLAIDTDTAVTVARDMLRRKGHNPPRPELVTKIEGQSVWYVQFRLPTTLIEIEVEHTPDRGWVRAISAVEDL